MNKSYIDYHQYIQSQDWKDRKNHWIKLFGNKCICGNIGENLHHRHYKSLGHEPPHQLILLCKKHHMFVHGLPDNFTTDKRTMKLRLRSLLRFYRKRHHPAGVTAQTSSL